MAGYDAFLLVSFGGPEGPDDVMPFLRNVTAGRGIPDERLADVAEHYYRLGGVSPINEQCRDLLAAVQKEFTATGIGLPAYWGNRNWQPYLDDTVRQMAADGVSSALAFVTSAYSSFSSCRQYLGDIEKARAKVGKTAPRIDKIRPYYNHPGFIDSFVASTAAAIGSLPHGLRDDAELVFVAHSIPLAMADASGPAGGAYQAQLGSVASLVTARLGRAASTVAARPWHLAYCSRSGPPSQPWLVPDINDMLADLAATGHRAVVLVPIGFVSDHMEVIFDLDIEAAQTARRLNLAFARAAAPGSDHRFVSMIVDLVRERLDGTPGIALGSLGASPDSCPAGCCGGLMSGGRPAAAARRHVADGRYAGPAAEK